jgi:hypothetical protein
MKNTASRDQLMMVAVNCPGYDPTCHGVTNTIGVENSKSCDNCHHWKDHKCSINLFDPVISSVDQT